MTKQIKTWQDAFDAGWSAVMTTHVGHAGEVTGFWSERHRFPSGARWSASGKTKEELLANIKAKEAEAATKPKLWRSPGSRIKEGAIVD